MAPTGRRNRLSAGALAGLVVAMVGLSFASVPLYRLFCQVTGFGGTPRIGAQATGGEIAAETIRVRFDANVSGGLGWRFEPLEREVTVRLGEERLVFYRATNVNAQPTVGTATFNVTPHDAGPYFVKVECFCFTEQALAAGESAEFPVSFSVDPSILERRATRTIHAITLSYTFFPVAEPKPARTARVGAAAAGGG